MTSWDMGQDEICYSIETDRFTICDYYSSEPDSRQLRIDYQLTRWDKIFDLQEGQDVYEFKVKWWSPLTEPEIGELVAAISILDEFIDCNRI